MFCSNFAHLFTSFPTRTPRCRQMRRSRFTKGRLSAEDSIIREPMEKVFERDWQFNEAMPPIERYPDGEYGKVVYWSKYEPINFVREYFLLVKEGDR